MTTLAIIRSKIRQVINLPSPSDITDAEIDGYINTFYLYDLPEHLRLLNLKTVYSFYTVANQHIYTFPRNQYLTIEGPIYVAGYQQQLYQSWWAIGETLEKDLEPKLDALEDQCRKFVD